MKWPKLKSNWIAVVYLLLLIERASGFSACQDPPQEIRISRGQKITVVYWVGQNAIDDDDFEDEIKTSTLAPSSEASETPNATTEEGIINSTDVVRDSSTSSNNIEQQSINQNEANDSTTLVPNLTDSPTRTSIPPSTTLHPNDLQKDASITTESDSTEFNLSGRSNFTSEEEDSTTNATSEEFAPRETTPILSEKSVPISDSATTTTAESLSNNVHSASTENQNDIPEISTVSGPQFRSAEQDGGTEVEYWSTTLVPEQTEEADTSEALLEGKEVTGTVESTSTIENDNNLSATTGHSGSSEEQELTGKSVEVTTTELIEDTTFAARVNELPNGNNQSEVSEGNSTDATASTTEDSETSTIVPLVGKSLETATSVPTLSSSEEPVNDNISTEFDGKLDSSINETATINSSESAGVQASDGLLASLKASTSQPTSAPQNGTEGDTEATSTDSISDSLSVFKTITTTIRNLFSSTDSPSEDDADSTTVTVPIIKGRESEPEENVTLAVENDGGILVPGTSTGSSIVFQNSTADPEILIIDPRDQDNNDANSTDEGTTTDAVNERRSPINDTESTLPPLTESTDLATKADTEEPTEGFVTSKTTTATDVTVTEGLMNSTDNVDEEQDNPAGEEVEDQRPQLVPIPEAINPFEEMPGMLIPIGGDQSSDEAEEGFMPDIDNAAEGGRRIDFPTGQFIPFASEGNGPILIPLSNNGVPFNEAKPQQDTPKRGYLPLPTEEVGQNPLVPPPIFLRFPNRGDNSFSNRHGFGLHDAPPVFMDDLQPEASSSTGPFYRSFYPPNPSFGVPAESPVHYVSILRPPDGVLPIQSLRMTPSKRRRVLESRAKRDVNDTSCEWIFKSDPGVPLLLTFKSFSTPETTDCEDHYISVERESNGFQSRWCGVSGERPGHASFARSEIRLHLFSTGDGSFPTGFSVEVQALDLKLLRKYAEVRRIIKHQ